MKAIEIELKKSQILLDVVGKMNVLGRTMELEEQSAVKILAGYIASPDDNDTKPIVARAMTEGFDRVKNVCQRYLVYGRTTDDNRLEALTSKNVVKTVTSSFGSGSENTVTVSLQKGKTYNFAIKNTSTAAKNISITSGADVTVINRQVDKDETALIQFTPASNITELMFSGQGSFVTNIYETVDCVMTLSLSMSNNFNEGMTSTIKSCAHHIIVSNILAEFLRDQNPEKAGSYKADIAEQESMLLNALNSVRPFSRRQQDWN